MLLHPFSSIKKVSTHRGFTMLEMIVAMSIFIVLTSVLLFNYNSFNNRITLDILAHQIAQWTRDTQVSAMSVRPSRTDLAKFSGFGLHFDIAARTSFIYFADLNGDKQYAPLTGLQKCGDPGIECEKVIQILKKNSIEKLCGLTSPPHAAGVCPLGLDEVEKFDIVFTRPNPDAAITGFIGAPSFQYSHADITIVSPAQYRRTIQVWTTGQISVQ